jgi:glutamate N-acetyltransferase/amino-acid N-acetyltransferase
VSVVALPGSFRGHAGRAGLRPGGGDDVALFFAERPCAVAGVFTRSLFAGPCVELSRRRVAAGRARAQVVVASNANVATGKRGLEDAIELSILAGRAAGVESDEVLVAGTGVIGRPWPMGLLSAHLSALEPASFVAGAEDLARAIMTTDTVPKIAEQSAGEASVVGFAKGSGMIEPDMATLLAFALTNAEVQPSVLERLWRKAVDETFNCLSIDTDTSTSDTAVVFADGAAGEVTEAELAVALRQVCLDLTLQLARDGEGATKLLTATVRGATSAAQAKRIAKSIAGSPLVKAAVHGADPNWGRVAMAIGKCHDQVGIDPGSVTISMCGEQCYPSIPGTDGLARLSALMRSDYVAIEVDLGVGSAEATVYGCDLSPEYVHINADYTT